MTGNNPGPTSEDTVRPALGFCIPIYNDWESAGILVCQLDRLAADLGAGALILLVDDGSKEGVPGGFAVGCSSSTCVQVLSLRRNMGHQRAIAIGLSCLSECHSGTLDIAVVMDGDGQDSPSGVRAMIERCRADGGREIIFANRRKRTEGPVFRMGYLCFRLLHIALVGRDIHIGNFSAIPAGLLHRVVAVSEIWNHYAAGVVHAKLPVATVPVDRAPRLAGETKMNLVSLVTHGMAAMSVFGDLVGVRLLLLLGVLSTAVCTGLLAVIAIRSFTELAIPGWATSAFGILSVLLVNMFVFAALIVLFVLNTRNSTGFLPMREWRQFVEPVKILHGR